jgi:2-haloacid dehalogenase
LLWRDKQIEYTRLVTTSNHGAHYQPFWALTRAALALCHQAGRPRARDDWPAYEARAEQLMNQYRT